MGSLTMQDALNGIDARYTKQMGGADLTPDQKFQLQMQQESEKNQLISNILKMLHDTAQGIIGNMR